MREAYIGFDVGTLSARAGVFDSAGRLIASRVWSKERRVMSNEPTPCESESECGAAATEPVGLQPFAIDHRAAGSTSLDLSFLLNAPAGAKGPIRIADGHFVQPDGTRFRWAE